MPNTSTINTPGNYWLGRQYPRRPATGGINDPNRLPPWMPPIRPSSGGTSDPNQWWPEWGYPSPAPPAATPAQPAYQPQAPDDRAYRQWLEANPDIQYQMAISGMSRPMQDWFGARYGTYYNKYLAALAQGPRDTGTGETALAGAKGTGLPTLKFGDWLSSYNWLQEYLSRSPQARGIYRSNLAPRGRWLNY